MKQLLFVFSILILPAALNGQNTFEAYAKAIYAMVLEQDQALYNQFVDLDDYTAYIDRLERLPNHLKEEIKRDATKSYTEVQKDYQRETARILKLYADAINEGATFKYSASEFEPSKNFPEIGFVTFYYIVTIPDFEEPEEDALRFEAIKTIDGWRILDGFFNAPNLP